MLKNYYRVLRPELLTLENGEKAVLRFLRPDDGALLYTFLESLAYSTRRHLMPHPVDPERIAHLCDTLDADNTLRLVATVDRDSRVIGYIQLHLDFTRADIRHYKAVGITVTPTIDCAVTFAVPTEYKRLGVLDGLYQKASAIGRMLGRDRTLYWHTYACPMVSLPVPVSSVNLVAAS